ncbi:hypothetical protein BCV69DRAFT_175277 [Microstroma glucosiphilum]|uniref:Uncharacterized protein n=1 Tax=Pseudomicrostroma glucosiphilum TaxID=1684307 RepID=A0A316U8L9_9BASI|nr:hypothetical protein BCV69DRAFT_175277 [Pseudomicrostroma glucosiphilum]PWN21600.1 hypothetical protein BCV69DRAFT_175277 [Pseudomicrostroma glucosiphilum]
MPAVLAPHPSLSPPVVLGSYAPSAGKAGKTVFQATAASSSRLSHAAVGEVVKLGSGSVRRARGLIVTVAAGASVTLIDAATHTAVQSFVLSNAVQPCTPPLVTLQSAGKGNTLRRTYLGLVAQDGSGSEVWAWNEVVKESSRSAANDANPERTTVRSKDVISSLHPLSSGEVLLRHGSGSYSVLSSSAAEVQPPILQISEISPQTNDNSASPHPRTVTHSVTVLDLVASAQIFGGGVRQEDSLGSLITFTSAGRSSGPSIPSGGAAGDSKDKKGRRRKTAIEVIDDAEGSTNRDGLTASGPLKVQVQRIGVASGPERLTSLGETAVSTIPDAASLLDVNLFHDGQVSMLTRSGDILFSRLSISASEGPQVSQSRTLSIAHISQEPSSSRPAALLRLSASHLLVVLRAAGGPSSGRLAALIWDTDLDALIVTSDWSAPVVPGLEEAERNASVSLTRVGGSQAIVEGCSWGGAQTGGTALATLWALPFTIPSSSVLRHAVGKAALTTAWSKQVQAKAASSSRAGADIEGQHQALLQRLQSIYSSSTADTVEKKSAEMEIAFASWLSEEGARVKAAWEKERLESQAAAAELAADDQSGSDDSDREPANLGGGEEKKLVRQRKNHRDERAPKVKLSYSFVATLLDLALPAAPSTARSAPYAKKILTYLMSRKSVSCGMLAGSGQSLIARLRARNDWGQIMDTIRNVSDVGERELVDLLVELLRNERSKEGESAVKTPLDVYLSQFVTMAVSRPLLRSTLHGHVTESSDVVVLLQVITRWLKDRAAEPLDLVSLAGADDELTGTMKKSTAGSRRRRLGDKSSQAKAPPTTDLLQFAMDLIDVYFPLLLNTPSMHGSLHSLSKALSAHLALCTSLSTLRGPLDAFTRLDTDRKRLQEESARRIAVQRARDPRAAKSLKASAGQAGAVQARSETGGGLGMEGLGKTVRLHALESSALVGPYTLESLDV